MRFVLGSMLPATGLCLVLYTAAMLATALVSGNVPPPAILAEASLDATSLPEQTPAQPPSSK